MAFNVEIHSKTHKVIAQGLTISVWPLQPNKVMTHAINAKGEVETKELVPQTITEMQMVEEVTKSPLFIAWLDKDGGFHVDVNCGMQRWLGYKTRREVGKALRKCGFGTNDVRKVFREITSPRLKECQTHTR
jgi:hypothetical protein